MAAKKKPSRETNISDDVRPLPIDVGTAVDPKSDHVHQWVFVGMLGEGEAMEQCSWCARMRKV